MNITSLPLTEYLQKCLDRAYHLGYKWVMVLLARKRDAEKSYQDLKENWESYNDLTGKHILFLFSLPNDYAVQVGRRFALHNPDLIIANDNFQQIYLDDHLKTIISHCQNAAIDYHSNFITDLCELYNISELNVPSLLMFRTVPGQSSKPIIIPLNKDNLYDTIKGLISHIETQLKELSNLRTDGKKIESQLSPIKRELQKVSFPEHIIQYIRTQSYINHIIDINPPEIDVDSLAKAIASNDIHVCDQFPPPIKENLLYLMKLKKKYPGIEKEISTKYSQEQKLYDQKIKLVNLLNNQTKIVSKYIDRMDDSIRQYVNNIEKKQVKERKSITANIPDFKIAVTFSGDYRNIIEPIVNELLNLGFKREEIFYDAWHEALINGVHGDRILREIYHNHCKCAVVLLSPDYKEKKWTNNIEWPAILELINEGEDHKICLLRIDSANIGEIDGLYNYQAIAKAIDGLTASEVALFIARKFYYITSR